MAKRGTRWSYAGLPSKMINPSLTSERGRLLVQIEADENAAPVAASNVHSMFRNKSIGEVGLGIVISFGNGEVLSRINLLVSIMILKDYLPVTRSYLLQHSIRSMVLLRLNLSMT